MLNLFQHLCLEQTPKQVRGDFNTNLLETMIYRIVNLQ